MSASEFNMEKKIFLAVASVLVSLGGARGCPVLAVVVQKQGSIMCGSHVRAADEGDISWLIKPRGLEDLYLSPHSFFAPHPCSHGRT